MPLYLGKVFRTTDKLSAHFNLKTGAKFLLNPLNVAKQFAADFNLQAAAKCSS